MRHSQFNPWPMLGQHTWADTLAQIFGLTDTSAVTRAAVARCLLAASVLRVAVSAVAARVAGVGRETVRQALGAELPEDLSTVEGRLAAGLRRHIPRMFERDPLVVLTHAHLDHVGGAHEFSERAAHKAAEQTLAQGVPASLFDARL